jgi:flagellar protein FliO/FliZ
MFDTLFGAEMPLAVRFFLAFLIVLGLIGATAWAVRRFGSGRLGANTRGRQPRLAVVDYASVDGRRRLILVRRDNVEHLLMIGGPSDIVVEPNIVRAVASPRDVPGARPAAGIDALTRAIPLPENGSNGSWPLQPEPAGGPRPSPRLDPLPDELPRSFQPMADPPPRLARDTLTTLADEISTRPTMPRSRPLTRPLPEEPSRDIDADIHKEQPKEHHAEPVLEARAELQLLPEPRVELRPEPRTEPRAEVRPEPRKPFAPPVAPPAPAPAAAETADQSLADMAQRLEAALRKPVEARTSTPTARPEPATPDAALPPPRAPRPSEPKPARPEAKPAPNAAQNKSALYDSLEQEMASLLGRQNKT